MTPDICVLGSINLDLIIQTDNLPKAGETIGGGSYQSLPGGKGANVALAAQKLGAKTELRAAIGRDSYAKQALINLKQANVGLDHLVQKDTHTGLAFINVDAKGENQIAVAAGANGTFMPSDLTEIKAKALIAQFEIPQETILAAFKNFDGFIVLNASPVMLDISAFLPLINLLIVNEAEYDAYKHFLKDYSQLLAVTLGAKGAVLYENNQEITRNVPPSVNVKDTTGAGDAFAAALTLAFIEKQSPSQALNFACRVGAMTTTRLGAQGASPDREELA